MAAPIASKSSEEAAGEAATASAGDPNRPLTPAEAMQGMMPRQREAFEMIVTRIFFARLCVESHIGDCRMRDV